MEAPLEEAPLEEAPLEEAPLAEAPPEEALPFHNALLVGASRAVAVVPGATATETSSLLAGQRFHDIATGDLLDAHMRSLAIRFEPPAPDHDRLALALVGLFEAALVELTD
jgi:hypothetical protein